MSPPLESRIRIEPDGTVLALSGKVEYGQGIRTAFAQLVADELDVPIERVKVILGDTDLVPWDIGTYGSMSLHADGRALQLAAAWARVLLLERASRKWSVAKEQLETGQGEVRCKPDGRVLAYPALIEDAPLSGPIPEDAPCKAPAARRWIGQSARRIEARGIVTGKSRFVADLRLPGMLRGQVLHPPVRGARLRSLDDSEARGMRGVVAVVHEGDFVGVVAERDEQALAAVQALEADWEMPESPAEAQGVDVVLRDDGATDEALARAAQAQRVIEATYVVPHISNAPIGPSAAVADVSGDRATLYTGTQRPFALRTEIAAGLGWPEERVHVLPQLTCGTYGRNSSGDAALEAARLSKAVGRPVLLQWTRADEFTQAPNRAEVVVEARAGLDETGHITGWWYSELTNPHTYVAAFKAEAAAATSGRNAVPFYELPSATVLLHVEPSPVRTAAFRSLAAAPNTFAIESLMDELAALCGADPLEFRLRHLEDPRLRRVLQTVAERSGWATRPRGQKGQGYGIACTIYHGTYVAEVAHVEVLDASRIRLVRVFCAIDPGVVVNPDGARNQTEGGIQQAASWVLQERLAHRNGKITSTSWETYPIATFREAPEHIDVTFVADGTAPMTGLGEPGSVPVAAAIANAVFAATGVRLRTLPLTLGAKSG
ncbi:MAG TPA: molybdopterin cofactor-binding domain-containing protein [Polyangia bacterium]|nr:molybdopterin cofactor-binding domain-containing protein [Polyangia bacterium]